MSDLAATSCCNDCGCGNLSNLSNNGGYGNNWCWILILLLCCGNNGIGYNNGYNNGCNDGCGYGNNWWIILILLLCGCNN